MQDDIIYKNDVDRGLNLFFKNIDNNLLNGGIKSLFNCWGKLIDNLIQDGNQHFGITINLPQNQIYLVEEYIGECQNYSRNGNCMNIEFTGQKFYEFNGEFVYELGLQPKKNSEGKFDSLKYVNCLSRDNIIHSSLRRCLENNFITSICFSVIENKNDRYHFHILVAIKNFIDYNYILKNNLQKLILFQLQNDYKELDWDVRVDSLLYYKDIKNWIMYMHKDIKNWTNKCLLLEDSSVNKLISNELYYIYNNKIIPSNSIDIYSINFQYPDKNIKKLGSFFFNIDLNNLSGIKIKDNIINQRILVNILQYYLILNSYYIYNNSIYERIKESKISYRHIGTIKEVLYDKFQENVVKFYLIHLNSYFSGFDFSYLMDNYFIKTKSIIESIKDISTQRIEPDFGLIEFSDGVYSIKYDRFFSNKDNYNFSNKVCTIKYYNKSYNRVRKDKPINWITGLKNALNIKNNELKNEDFIRLCLHIINPIHKDIFSKKSTLFVYGQSNTGKTTLISNVLSEYFGSENIGSIISAKNFKWQDLIGKTLGIIDEARYNSSMSSDLLKITGQEKIIVEKKYSKEHISIDPIPLIILTNILFEDKNVNIDEALKNRLYIIEFINTISNGGLKNSKGFKIKIKNEEPNIVIYCNKLLFKIKEDSLKKFGNKISNEKILKLIEIK